MNDPCKWCDGKTIWSGTKWTQKERCEEEEDCPFFQEYKRQKEEQVKHEFPENCFLQVIIREEPTGRKDRVVNFFIGEDKRVYERMIGKIATEITMDMINKGELPF